MNWNETFSFITPLPENPSVCDCFTLMPCPTDASCIPQAHSCCVPPPLCSNVLDPLDVWILNSKSLAIAHPAREACWKCYSQGFCRVAGFWTCNFPSRISETMATMQLLMPLTITTLLRPLLSDWHCAEHLMCIFSFNFSATLWAKCYHCPYSPEKETKAQRGLLTCPRSKG